MSRLSTLLLKLTDEIGEGGKSLRLLGGVVVIRRLISKPSDRNIRRIGSLQSHIVSFVPGEVMGVAVMVGDELCESAGQEASDSGGSSTHHRLDMPSRSFATILSPSSLPQMSGKIMSRGRTDRKESVNL